MQILLACYETKQRGLAAVLLQILEDLSSLTGDNGLSSQVILLQQWQSYS
jgi:hypothetical protein